MNEASRKTKNDIIQTNCDSCAHKQVCKYTEAFDAAVSRIIKTAQVEEHILSCTVNCRYRRFTV